MASNTQLYGIHYNGGTPYVVEVTPELVSIYENTGDRDHLAMGALITSFKYLSLFIGDNDLEDEHYAEKGLYKGNSILVRRYGGRYTYIGSEIYTFALAKGDRIVSYYSPVGNSDVPYPYAVGEQRAYFMLDKQSVPVEAIDATKDGYGQFYDGLEDSDDLADYKNIKIIREEEY